MKRKEGIVKIVGFSSLSFSLVSGIAMAQQQLPSQLLSNQNGNNSGAANMVAGNVNTVAVDDVITQPVVVTPSMAPVQAPVIDSGSSLRVGQNGVSVPSGPATGIGGSNMGNANTGGLQVQNVTVQASPEATANSTAINSEYQRAEMLRQRRVRREVENETRLLERLEEGRLADERVREGSIEGYYSSVAGSAASASASASGNEASASAAAAAVASNDLQTVPVAQTGATATAVATATAGDVSVLSTEAEFLGMSSFSLSPFIGYRWFDNNAPVAYRARNVFTAGLMMQGKFNQYLSFEGSFAYGYDKFYMNQIAYGYFGMPNNYNFNTGESRDTFELNGGLRLSKTFSNVFTPYIAGSVGGLLSKYNIDNPYVQNYHRSIGLARMTTHFMGNLGGGMDYQVASNLSLGVRFDYQAVLDGDSVSFDPSVGQNAMSAIWGDRADRYRATGSLNLVF